VFRKLSEKRLPLKLPAITFYPSNIGQVGIAIKNRRGAISIESNLNNTVESMYEVMPVKLDIEIGLIASNINDYFNLSSSYFKLYKASTFTVVLDDLKSKPELNLSLFDIGELSTPPAGKESNDFESRGAFYTYEGRFSLNTFIFYSSEYKIIRDLNVTWDLGLVEDFNTTK